MQRHAFGERPAVASSAAASGTRQILQQQAGSAQPLGLHTGCQLFLPKSAGLAAWAAMQRHRLGKRDLAWHVRLQGRTGGAMQGAAALSWAHRLWGHSWPTCCPVLCPSRTSLQWQ